MTVVRAERNGKKIVAIKDDLDNGTIITVRLPLIVPCPKLSLPPFYHQNTEFSRYFISGLVLYNGYEIFLS